MADLARRSSGGGSIGILVGKFHLDKRRSSSISSGGPAGSRGRSDGHGGGEFAGTSRGEGYRHSRRLVLVE